MRWRLTSVTILITCMVTQIAWADDIGVYSGGGKINEEYYFTVHTPHNFEVKKEGSTVTLICPFQIENSVSPVEWLKEYNGKLQPFEFGTGYFGIRFKSLKLTDAGTYACKVCSVHGCVFTYSQLIVIDKTLDSKATFKQTPQFTKYNIRFSKGATEKIYCPHVKANNESSFQWFKEDDKQLRPYNNRRNLEFLTLENLSESDSGMYACEVCFDVACFFIYFQLTVIKSTSTKKPQLVSTIYEETTKSEPYSVKTFYAETTSEKPDSETTTPMKEPHSNNGLYIAKIIFTFCICLFFLSVSFVTAFIMLRDFWRKKKREKKRRRLAKELSLAAQLPRWTKRVIVEKQTCAIDGHTPSGRFNGTGTLVIVFQTMYLLGCSLFDETLAKAYTRVMTGYRQGLSNWFTVSDCIYLDLFDKPQARQDATKMMPSVRIENHLLCRPDGKHQKYEFPFDPAWEVPRDSLDIGRVLGEGAFGKVMQAEARRLFQQDTTITVAVKTLKGNHTDNDLIQFVKEMELMKMLGKHFNIIKLLGCCTQNGPLLVIMEFAPHGNLRDFLRKHRTCLRISKDCNCLTERDLVSFAYQVAKGMDYLASSKYIHGDLAARNVLVSENYVLKISDFGLARKLQQKDYYRKEINGLLPIKWMAPEFLFDNVYTAQSDVWSYGVLLWEMMTLGGSPYPSVTSIGQLYKLLHHGYRMEKPSHCTQQMYTVMMECWKFRPTERPSFDKLVNIMNDMLAATTTLEYLEVCKPQSDSTPPVPGSSEEVELIVNFLPDAKLRRCFSRNADIT